MSEHEPKGQKPEPEHDDEETAASKPSESKVQAEKAKPSGGAEERNVGG